MEALSPFRIETREDSSRGIRELHFTFTPAFQSLSHENQIDLFETYINYLKTDMDKTNDLASRQGMLTVLQISAQLLPHLKDNELPLDETIIVEMGEQAEGSSLADLINNSKTN